MMLTRNRLGLPQLAQKHLDRDDAPVRDAAHRRDGRRSRVRGQGTIHPGAFLNQSQGEMRRWWGSTDGAGSFSKYG